MYLDTGPMTVWPILGFPFDTLTQAIDQSQLQRCWRTTSCSCCSRNCRRRRRGHGACRQAEQVVLPGGVSQKNPYTYGVDFDQLSTVSSVQSGVVSAATTMSAEHSLGLQVKNLNPGFVADTSTTDLSAGFSRATQQTTGSDRQASPRSRRLGPRSR